MSRRTVLLAVAVALMAAVPIAAKQSKPKETRVTDSSGALSVVVPVGWKSNKSGFMGSKLILFGPEREGFRININLATERVGSTSLSDYAVGERGHACRR